MNWGQLRKSIQLMFLFNVLQLLFDIFQFRTFQTKMFESKPRFRTRSSQGQVHFISTLSILGLENLLAFIFGNFSQISKFIVYLSLFSQDNGQFAFETIAWKSFIAWNLSKWKIKNLFDIKFNIINNITLVFFKNQSIIWL